MSNPHFINLVPIGLTRGATLQGAYILIFRETLGMRCMAALVSPEEYRMVSRAMQGELSEMAMLMRQTLDTFGIRLHSVVLHNNTPHGEYRAELLLQQGADLRHIRQSVGVGTVLALAFKAHLQVSATYFDQMTHGTAAAGDMVQVRVPISAMDERLLKEALDQAVASDDFEMASTLRDELHRREASSHTSTTTAL